MKIKFLENGMDSLSKGYMFLQDYEKKLLDENIDEKERYFLLKDAILSIHHAIEIMFKSILIKHSEFLIYSEINKHVKDAYREKNKKGLSSIFETTLKNKVHTATFEESINRVETICGYPLDKDLKEKINQLNSYRNLIIHSEIFLTESDINNTFKSFIDKLDIYFYKILGDSYKTLSGYSDLCENYDEYKKNLDKREVQLKSNITEKFINVFNKHSISMGEDEVKTIIDINIAMNIIDELQEIGITFGIDLYNSYCSGSTQIKRISEFEVSFFTHDNNSDYIFRFKSMLIYMPQIDSSYSPILFFESDKLEVDKELVPFIEKNYDGKEQLSGLHFVDDEKEIYGNKNIHAFEEKLEYDEYSIIPNYYSIEKFIDPIGVFGFVNIQGLDYGNFRKILHDFKGKTLKELETVFKETLQSQTKSSGEYTDH